MKFVEIFHFKDLTVDSLPKKITFNFIINISSLFYFIIAIFLGISLTISFFYLFQRISNFYSLKEGLKIQPKVFQLSTRGKRNLQSEYLPVYDVSDHSGGGGGGGRGGHSDLSISHHSLQQSQHHNQYPPQNPLQNHYIGHSSQVRTQQNSQSNNSNHGAEHYGEYFYPLDSTISDQNNSSRYYSPTKNQTNSTTHSSYSAVNSSSPPQFSSDEMNSPRAHTSSSSSSPSPPYSLPPQLPSTTSRPPGWTFRLM